jgi:multisubunit Na+/H+ antiporter MnhE subunit
MKALIAVLVIALAPAHIRFAVAGVPVSVSAAWLILAAELLAAELLVAVVLAVIVIRVIRRLRSAPWMRPIAGGAR